MVKKKSHLTGAFYEFGGEEECTDEVRSAVVTKERIAIDWEDDGVKYLASLHSEDGYYYEGHYGSPGPEKAAVMKGWLYKSISNEYLFWLEWNRTDTGDCGGSIVFLTPSDSDEM